MLGAIVIASCEAPPARPIETAPQRTPEPAPAASSPLTDGEVLELVLRARQEDHPRDHARFCIRRVEGAPAYVRVGEREERGGCRLAAVVHGEQVELRGGNTNRFESDLMRDLGLSTASADERGTLLLRWLRESRFALSPGDGPFLVDDDLAQSVGVTPPAAFEEDGMPKVRYWQRAIRRTREAPDDWYWLYTEKVTTFDPTGRPLGTASRNERRIPMDEAPTWATKAR